MPLIETVVINLPKNLVSTVSFSVSRDAVLYL